MKNPFTHPDLPPGRAWELDSNGPHLVLMTQEQSEYAAHAINQHDKLVAMLVDIQWCAEVDGEYCCPVCYESRSHHDPDCTLAALLAEEDAK